MNGIGALLGGRQEDRLDRLAEQARDAEGERQARVVLAGFDRVDGLARNRQPFGQLALRPALCLAQFADAALFKDSTQLIADLDAGELPTFSYVKARAYRNEHPNVSKISDGVAFVKTIVDAVKLSSVASSTLVLLTWDEGGGFFDHLAPPAGIDDDPESPIHPVPYGTRVPMLALGPYARAGAVSHVTMEHSSVVKFLEYNFLGPVGQLGANDGKVKNIGSLLDPTRTGIVIPED